MALGWLYLYSRYRKTQRSLREQEFLRAAEGEICMVCSFPRRQHADDEDESCPTYFN